MCLIKSSRHIFLAEDDDDDCLLFKDVLKELSSAATLTIAQNGERLMEMLHQVRRMPDMIFLDLNMPRKNGFECLEEIKQDARFRNMPVIVFSTTAENRTIDRVYNQGASLYLPKPCDYNRLKTAIRLVLAVNWKKKTARPSKEEFVLSV